MSHAAAPYSIEERIVCGETLWIAIRARGAEWSWLTPKEAVAIARAWLEKYDQAENQANHTFSGIMQEEASSAGKALAFAGTQPSLCHANEQ